MNPINGSYGVPRDVYAKVKQAGLVILDIAIVTVATLGGGMIGLNLFPKTQVIQMLCFILLTPLIVIYLLFPANGDKKNWHSLYLAVKRRKKRFISFEYLRGEYNDF